MLLNIAEVNDQIRSAVDHFSSELKKVNTGKANVQAIESIMVEAYGSSVALNTIGQVIPEDAINVKVNVWDKNVLPNVDKALRESSIGASVAIDKDFIRLKFNPITEEDRKQRARELNQMLENCRVRIRHIRQEHKKRLDSLTGVSEDEQKRDEETLQKTIDEAIKNVEAIAERKETEIFKI